MTRGQIVYFVGIILVFIGLVLQSVYTHAEKTIYLEDGSTVITDDNVFVFEGQLYTLTGGRANKLVIKPAIPLEVEEAQVCGELTFGGEGCIEEEEEEDPEEDQECDGLTFGGGEC